MSTTTSRAAYLEAEGFRLAAHATLNVFGALTLEITAGWIDAEGLLTDEELVAEYRVEGLPQDGTVMEDTIAALLDGEYQFKEIHSQGPYIGEASLSAFVTGLTSARPLNLIEQGDTDGCEK